MNLNTFGGLYCINMSEVLDLWSKVNDLYLTLTCRPPPSYIWTLLYG